MNWIKHKVSGTRRRMENSKIDIDLTYILNDRLIVMSYPSSGKESFYRNNYVDVSLNTLSILNNTCVILINIGQKIS